MCLNSTLATIAAKKHASANSSQSDDVIMTNIIQSTITQSVNKSNIFFARLHLFMIVKISSTHCTYVDCSTGPILGTEIHSISNSSYFHITFVFVRERLIAACQYFPIDTLSYDNCHSIESTECIICEVMITKS